LIITSDILVLAGREMLFLLIMFLTGIERSGNADQEKILLRRQTGIEKTVSFINLNEPILRKANNKRCVNSIRRNKRAA